MNRSRKKAPKLRALDRILLGLSAMLVSPQRILKLAVAIRPSTLLRLQGWLRLLRQIFHQDKWICLGGG